MAITKNWSEIRAQRAQRPDDAERQAAARARLEQQDRAYFARLAGLRKARRLSQSALAERVNMAQPSVSRLERQADLHVSTLRRCIEAMGGRLEVHAVFPDDDVEAADAVEGAFGGTGGGSGAEVSAFGPATSCSAPPWEPPHASPQANLLLDDAPAG